MSTHSIELPVSTSDGQFIAHYSEKGLVELDWPAKRNGRVLSSNPKTPLQILRWHRLTAAALKKVLAGGDPGELPPLDIVGTDFQKSVWAVMRKIARGKAKSYGEVAQAIGNPKAVRAVGSACGANPLPVLIPCHRILAAKGKLGGFGGGLAWKRTLLTREGTEFRN